MKKYIVVLAALVQLYSCEKPKLVQYGYPYSVTGQQAQYVQPGMQTPFTQHLLLKDDEGLSFAIQPDSLPPGITMTPDSVVVHAGDSVILNFYSDIATSGTYPVSLKVSNPLRKPQTISFDVIAEQDCGLSLGGNWNVYDSGWTATMLPSHYTAIASHYGAFEVNFGLYAWDLDCTLSCHNGTLTSAPFNGFSYVQAGTGKFTANRVEITYTVIAGSSSQKVTSIMTR